LNVEDDLVAVNNQIVLGWSMFSINKFLEDEFNRSESVFLILRKMPKDNAISLQKYRNFEEQQLNNQIKQQAAKNGKLGPGESGDNNGLHQRKSSFSDIFLA
jgi:hypothetical protein